jgi:hypothetical protein
VALLYHQADAAVTPSATRHGAHCAAATGTCQARHTSQKPAVTRSHGPEHRIHVDTLRHHREPPCAAAQAQLLTPRAPCNCHCKAAPHHHATTPPHPQPVQARAQPAACLRSKEGNLHWNLLISAAGPSEDLPHHLGTWEHTVRGPNGRDPFSWQMLCLCAGLHLYVLDKCSAYLSFVFFSFFDWFGMRSRTPRATHSKISALLKLALTCQVGLTKHLLVCLHTTSHRPPGRWPADRAPLHTSAGCPAPAAGGCATPQVVPCDS